MSRRRSGLQRLAIVGGGYVAAAVGAWFAVRVYVALTAGVDRVGAGGMTAFGDSLTFLAILALLSAPVTCLALYYLRPYPRFWQAALGFSLPVAVTVLTAGVAYLPAFRASTSTWVMASPIRILLAPIFGLAFLLLAVFCPTPSYRLVFMAATALEALVFVGVVAFLITAAR